MAFNLAGAVKLYDYLLLVLVLILNSRHSCLLLFADILVLARRLLLIWSPTSLEWFVIDLALRGVTAVPQSSLLHAPLYNRVAIRVNLDKESQTPGLIFDPLSNLNQQRLEI